jgi:hypothetical protein
MHFPQISQKSADKKKELICGICEICEKILSVYFTTAY